jgi:hypothetical protein
LTLDDFKETTMTKFLESARHFDAAARASAQSLTDLNGGRKRRRDQHRRVRHSRGGRDVENCEVSVTRIFNIRHDDRRSHPHRRHWDPGPTVLNFPASLNGRTGDFAMTFRLGETPGVFTARPAIGINTIDDAIQAILGGNAYVNVHTSQNPGGEIRGQLILVNVN